MFLKSLTTLSGGSSPLWAVENFFWVVNFILGSVAPPWLLAGIPNNGLSPPIEGKSQTWRVVFDFKNIYEIFNFYFTTP